MRGVLLASIANCSSPTDHGCTPPPHAAMEPWLKCNRDDLTKQILLYEKTSLYALAANL
jgi:hypothetical protein